MLKDAKAGAQETIDFETPGGVYNALPQRIVFGAGKAATIKPEVERLGAKRPLFLSTPGRKGLADRLSETMATQCAGVYAHAVSQVPIEMAREAVAYVGNHDVDCLVTVGGGASVGLGKAIALETGLPMIALPTTYSGSEMTGFCGITIDGVKRMHTSLNMLARTVIYDPELTMSLPMAISAQSGMNALAHCIEALYVSTASPVVASAAMTGIRAIATYFPVLVDTPEDSTARAGALYGAYLAGAALTGGFALHHGIAHVFGGTYGIPHSISHSIALPYVAAYNEAGGARGLAKVAEVFGTKTAASGIWQFAKGIGAPTCLADYGFSASDIDCCVELVIETDNGLNPVPVTEDGARQIVEAALKGDCPA